MIKKLFALTLVVIMVFTSMSAVAFADESGSAGYPNLIVDVYPDNPDCKHSEDADVKVMIKKDDATLATIEPDYDDEWGSYYFEDKKDEIDAIIDAIIADTALMDEYLAWMADLDTEEDFDILSKAGYSVEAEVDDHDDDHEITKYVIDNSIYTKDIIKETTDAMANILALAIISSCSTDEVVEFAGYLGGVNLVAKDGTAYIVYADDANKDDKAVEFDDLLQLLKNEEVVKEMELEEEELAVIKEYEDMMADATYKGELYIDVSFECDCPELCEYTLYHEYYESKDSKEPEESVAVDKEAPADSIIKQKDIKLFEKYDGKEYKFDGLYIVDEDGECDWNAPVKEFKVPGIDDDEYLEIVVRYVAVGESSGESNDFDEEDPSLDESGIEGTTPKDGDGSKDKIDKAGEKIDKTVDTGDDFNVLPLVAVMTLALIGMAAAFIRRRA